MDNVIFHDYKPEAPSLYAAAVEGFVRAASLDLPRSIRINAVSPPMAKETVEKLGRVNGGVPTDSVARPYVEAATGRMTGNVLAYRSSADE